jgi:hypothetical protein
MLVIRLYCTYRIRSSACNYIVNTASKLMLVIRLKILHQVHKPHQSWCLCTHFVYASLELMAVMSYLQMCWGKIIWFHHLKRNINSHTQCKTKIRRVFTKNNLLHRNYSTCRYIEFLNLEFYNESSTLLLAKYRSLLKRNDLDMPGSYTASLHVNQNS